MATTRRQTRLRGRGLGVTEDFASEAAAKSITKLGRIKQLGEEKVAAQTAVAPQVTGTGPAAVAPPPTTPSAPPPVTPPATPTLVPAGPGQAPTVEGPGQGMGTDTSGMTGFESTAAGQTALGRGVSAVGNLVADVMTGVIPDPGSFLARGLLDHARGQNQVLSGVTPSMPDYGAAGKRGMHEATRGFTVGTEGMPSTTGEGSIGPIGALGVDAGVGTSGPMGLAAAIGGAGPGAAPGAVGSMGGGPPSATGDPAGLGGSGVGGGGVK
jgi:hypothetical protein